MSNDELKFNKLIIKCLEGEISPEEIEQFNNTLSTNPEACKIYVETVFINSQISSPSNIGSYVFNTEDASLSSSFDDDLWREISEYENTAPTTEVPKEEPERKLIQKVVYPPQEKRKISKFSLFTFGMSAAAMLFFIMFLRFAPVKQYAVEVATLMDQVNVKWADSQVHFNNGDRLWTNNVPVGLNRGVVKIQYDNDVDVLIEGPAKFTLERSRVYLEYGRLFSRVSKSGRGFTVKTPTSQFIDLGTEFGVQADVDGSVELHVIKGQVQLFAGSNGNVKSGRMLNEDEAVRYNANSGKISEIPIERESFVRAINSKTKTVWRGQIRLNLASIVAGLDGFKEVDSLVGLDPTNGKYKKLVVGKDRATNNTYSSVMDSDFIDGVFVPDGGEGAIPVTSAGHTFACPDTSGVFTHEIAVCKGDIENQGITIPPAIFNGEKFNNDSVVMLHSNIGITFDLQAIRQSLPEMELKGFKAFGGLTEALDYIEEDRPDVTFWILVDEQTRYEKKMLKIEDGPVSVNVEFGPQDRFLTLVVTDGLRGAEGENRKYPYGNDFFYLIGPELCLTDIRSDR